MIRRWVPRLRRPALWAGVTLSAVVVAVLTGLIGMHGLGAPATAGHHACSASPGAAGSAGDHHHPDPADGHSCHQGPVCQSGHVERHSTADDQATTHITVSAAAGGAACPLLVHDVSGTGCGPPDLARLSVLRI